MNAAEARVWLDLLAELAPKIRDQGITHVELGPLKFDVALVQVIEVPARRAARDEDDESNPGMTSDPLDDPDTFDGKSAPSYEALRD